MSSRKSTKSRVSKHREGTKPKQCSKERQGVVLDGHHDIITCILPLGQDRIASGSDDGELIIWNSVSGTLIERIQAHRHAILCMTMLDDETLVTGSIDKSLKLWDLTTYQCVQQLVGHSGRVSCVVLLEGISKAMIGTSESASLSASSPASPLVVSGLTTSEDVGPLLCSGGSDGLLMIWSRIGQEGQIQRQENDNLHCLLQMGNVLITGSNAEYILVYDIPSVSYKTLLSCHRDSVRCLMKVSETVFLSGSLDGIIRLWDVTTLLPLVTLENPEQFIEISDARKFYCCPVLRVTPLFDDHIIASIGRGFHIYDIHSRKRVYQLAKVHKSDIVDLVSLHNGYEFATCSEDSSIKIWSVTSAPRKLKATSSQAPSEEPNFQVKLKEKLSGHTAAVKKLCAFSTLSFASGGADNRIILWIHIGKVVEERGSGKSEIELASSSSEANFKREFDDTYTMKMYCRGFRVFDFYEPDVYHCSSVADEKYDLSEPILEYVRGLTLRGMEGDKNGILERLKGEGYGEYILGNVEMFLNDLEDDEILN